MIAYLDLAPVIATLRERPEEFRDLGGRLHHVPSRHTFAFAQDGTTKVVADCDCSFLPTRQEDDSRLRSAYSEWYESFWRPFEINREFATHFEKPSLWRRLCVKLLTHLLEHQQSAPPKQSFLHRSAVELP